MDALPELGRPGTSEGPRPKTAPNPNPGGGGARGRTPTSSRQHSSRGGAPPSSARTNMSQRSARSARSGAGAPPSSMGGASYFDKINGGNAPWNWSEYQNGDLPPGAGYAPSMSNVTVSPSIKEYAWGKEPVKAWHRFYWEGSKKEEDEVQGRGTVMRHFDCYNTWENEFQVPHNFNLWKYSRHFYSQTSSKGGGHGWAKHSSLPMEKMDIRNMARQVSEIYPRTVHDVKPLFVLFQSLLRFLLDDRLQVYLTELEEKSSELEDFKTQFSKRIEVETETLKNNYQKHINELEKTMINIQGRLVDSYAREEEKRKKEDEMVEGLVAPRKTEKDPDSKSELAHDLLLALDASTAKSTEREVSRQQEVDAKVANAVKLQETQKRLEQDNKVNIGEMKEEIASMRARVRTTDELLLESQNQVLELTKERGSIMLGLEKYKAELGEWRERALAAEAARDEDESKMATCTCGAFGEPADGRPMSGLSRRKAAGAGSEGGAYVSVFSDVLARVGQAKGFRDVHSECQTIVDRVRSLIDVSASVAKSLPPSQPNAPLRGLEYVAATENMQELVGMQQDYSCGVGPEAAGSRSRVVVTDLTRDKSVYWWRNAETGKISATGKAGKGLPGQGRGGTLVAAPVVAVASGECEGVLYVDTVGRPARELSSREHDIINEAAQVIGNLYDVVAEHKTKAIKLVVERSVGMRSRPVDWKDGHWSNMTSALAEYERVRTSIEFALTAPEMLADLVALTLEPYPRVEAVYIVAMLQMFVDRNKMPADAMKTPYSPKKTRDLWELLKKELVLFNKGTPFAPSDAKDGPPTTLEKMRGVRNTEKDLEMWKAEGAFVQEAMAMVTDTSARTMSPPLQMMREWLLVAAVCRELYKAKVTLQDAAVAKGGKAWEERLKSDETAADREVPLSDWSKAVLARAEHGHTAHRRKAENNPMMKAPVQGQLDEEGSGEPLATVADDLPTSG